jgi:hypothetical protein
MDSKLKLSGCSMIDAAVFKIQNSGVTVCVWCVVYIPRGFCTYVYTVKDLLTVKVSVFQFFALHTAVYRLRDAMVKMR